MKKAKKKTTPENFYLPNPHLGKCIKWWQSNGTFNVDLYLLICKTRSENTLL